MKEVTDADLPQVRLLPLWLETSLTLVTWNLSVAFIKTEEVTQVQGNSAVDCLWFVKMTIKKKPGTLTHWSEVAPWSHSSRTPEDGSSSPPAPHTLSCSLAGNIQNHCRT